MMKRLIKLSTAILLATSITIAMAMPKVAGTKTYVSQNNFKTTVHKLKRALLADHFLIKAVIDHEKIARSIGHKVLPTTEFLVGKPSFEYPLIKAHPVAALFVPLTIVVWQDKHKSVHVTYWDPDTNIRPMLHFAGRDALKAINSMTASLKQVTLAATEK